MAEKHVSIKLLGDAKEAYLALKKIVDEERRKGVQSSFNQTLLRSIEEKSQYSNATTTSGYTYRRTG